MVEEILAATGADSYRMFLSGPDNFRYRVYPEYKANRLDAKRPKWEKDVKTFLELDWNGEWSEGCEADDMMGVWQYKLRRPFGEVGVKTEGQMYDKWEGFESIICTIDKDLDMIPGPHYNFVKKELYYVTPEESLYNFYYQLLVGDTADGIKGVPGIGPIKAKRILGMCESEREMFEACREAYGNDDEMEMNAKCLWIWRKEGDIWKWPKLEGMERST